MIYPQKLSSKKSDKLINALLICSVIITLMLFFINKITSPSIPWSGIANAGIIYIWITVLYSVKRNTNIAAHVLLQMIIVSILLLYIDNRLNFYGWSIYIGIPITIMVANVTMLVLSIVSYKKYTKYAIYQLVIVLLSMLQVVLAFNGIIELKILNNISIGVSLFNLIFSLILSCKDFVKVLICKFHM